ncbi:MAG: hypothetical protein AABX70_08290 [Nanoarchaeota archaeon]
MSVAMAEEGLMYEQEELGLLSHFFQNARTFCQILGQEMRDQKIQEYGALLESLTHSLDHAWPLVESLEKRGSADLKDIQVCIEKVNTFLGVVRTHKLLSPMDKKELTDAVGGLQRDVADFDLEENKVHQLVRGIKDQLKKVVSLLSENVKGFTGKSLEALKSLVGTFEESFGKLVEKKGIVKGRLVIQLKSFLREKEAEAVGLLGDQNTLPGFSSQSD